ncbi:MAG: hypothetical protein NTZ15_03095 [Burkholderiales bacterium]|nr:hypothetical protein [Burkholderiales bacterium]
MFNLHRRTTLAYFGSLPLVWAVGRTALAAPPADPAWLIEGAWLVSVEGDPRDRFLSLAGVQRQGDSLEVASTAYGYLDGTAKPVRQWQARVVGDSIHIQFLTPGDSIITAVLDANGAAILGQFENSKGKQRPVRLTKLPSSELAELRQAGKASKKLTASIRSDSRIVLLYVGASDCPSCSGYQAEYFGRKNLMAVQLPEFPQITYLQARLGSYRAAPMVANVLPPELAPLARSGPQGQAPQIRCHGTPYFALIVDEQLIAQAHGISGLETLLIPQVKQAVAMRRSAS